MVLLHIPIPEIANIAMEYLCLLVDGISLFECACICGYYEQCMPASQPKNFNADRGLRLASEYGHSEIVRLMLDIGVTAWDPALQNACGYGYVDIMKLLIQRYVHHEHWKVCLRYAGLRGSITTTVIKERYNVRCWDIALWRACTYDSTEMAQLMIDNGAKDVRNALICAAATGCLNTAQMMLDHGANNLNSAMTMAIEYNQVEMVKLLMLEASNWRHALVVADDYRRPKIVQLIEDARDSVESAAIL